MPFPELEAQAAQALLVAAVAAGDLPGMGPGAKPSVMAPKGQVRSLGREGPAALLQQQEDTLRRHPHAAVITRDGLTWFTRKK